MKLDILSYFDLIHKKPASMKSLEAALFTKGIVGVKNIPDFENKSRIFIETARTFSLLDDNVKKKYSPNRDAGESEGYELGAERFMNSNGHWQIDNKKASFYAFVPDDIRNKWPREVNLQIPYLELGKLMFETGKIVLNAIGLNEQVGLCHESLQGYGRLLHYQKDYDLENIPDENNTVYNDSVNNPEWCGAHFDHGVFTGLIPAWYFRQGQEVKEPEDAGLHIQEIGSPYFEKVSLVDKSILLFQVGEFAQLILNDRIKATKHMVKKADNNIERFTFALFFSAAPDMKIQSRSLLTKDTRYNQHQTIDGSVAYRQWENASLDRYRAK